MHRRILFSSVLLLVASSMAVAGLNFVETWEAYPVGSIPSGPWYVDPHMPDGGLTIVDDSLYPIPSLGRSLLVNYAGFNGKDAGIQAKLVPDGQEVRGADNGVDAQGKAVTHELTVVYNALGELAAQSDWYVEISLGDVHAPRLADVGTFNPLPSPIPVIAYCKPLLDPAQKHRATFFFDGRQWWGHGFMDYDESWGQLTAKVSTNYVRVACLCNNNPFNIPRAYLGNFDRVSIYTRDGIYSTRTLLDNVSITGGDILSTLDVSPADTFVSLGPVGGPFAPACRTYTLTNIGSAPMNWTASKNQSWLTLSASSGTLAPGASTTVNVCVNTNANQLAQGLSTDAVTFTDLLHNFSQNRNVELYVGQIDSYTEEFNGSIDLNNRSVMLTPDGSTHFYKACGVPTTQFPTPPSGGINLPLSIDNSVKVTLQQGQVSLYGTPYSEFYVGSNGYITFGEGDITFSGTTVDHFKKRRISGLFADLAPQEGTGAVSYRQLMDRVAVTYQNVRRAGTSETNNFQIEMFYDGRIRLTWLGIATNSGVVGLSKGLGTPTNFHNSDFSAYAACPSAGYIGDFDDDGDVDQADFGHLQTCLAPVLTLIVDPACADADVDLDGTVGQADVLAFYACFDGPNITPPSTCKEFGNP